MINHVTHGSLWVRANVRPLPKNTVGLTCKSMSYNSYIQTRELMDVFEITGEDLERELDAVGLPFDIRCVADHFNPLAPEIFFFILAHPVYKM